MIFNDSFIFIQPCWSMVRREIEKSWFKKKAELLFQWAYSIKKIFFLKRDREKHTIYKSN